jgi:hypothetical protein
MATTPVTPTVTAPAKVSWLQHFGQILAKVLGVVAKDGAAIEKMAVPVAEALLPQFAPAIALADNLATSILKQITVTQGAAAAVGTANTGPEKLQAVTDGITAELNAWVAAAFPGAKTVSAAAKSGLVQAIYNIASEIETPATQALPTVATVSTATTAQVTATT